MDKIQKAYKKAIGDSLKEVFDYIKGRNKKNKKDVQQKKDK